MSETLATPIAQPDITNFVLQSMEFRFDDAGDFIGVEAFVSFGFDQDGAFSERVTIPMTFGKTAVLNNLTQDERDALLSIRTKVITAARNSV